MFDIVQKRDESIYEFVEIFNREAIHASNLMDDIRIIAFVKALLPNSRLAFELPWKNPTSIRKMYIIAHEHMVAQELLSQRRTYVTRGFKQRAEVRKKHIRNRQKNPEQRAGNRRDFQKSLSFTPLNAFQGYILFVLKRDGDVSWLRAMSEGAKRDE